MIEKPTFAIGDPPALLIVSVCGALATPGCWLVKVRLDGLTLKAGGATPVPLRDTVCVRRASADGQRAGDRARLRGSEDHADGANRARRQLRAAGVRLLKLAARWKSTIAGQRHAACLSSSRTARRRAGHPASREKRAKRGGFRTSVGAATPVPLSLDGLRSRSVSKRQQAGRPAPACVGANSTCSWQPEFAARAGRAAGVAAENKRRRDRDAADGDSARALLLVAGTCSGDEVDRSHFHLAELTVAGVRLTAPAVIRFR